MKRKRPSAAARSGAAKKSLVVQMTNGLKSKVGSWIQGIFRQDNDSDSRVTWSDDSGSSCEEAEDIPAASCDPFAQNSVPAGSSSSSSPAQTNAHGAGLTAEHRTPLGNDRPEYQSFKEGFAIRSPASLAKVHLQKPFPAPARPCRDAATQYEEDDDMSSTSGFSSRHSDRDTVISWTLKCEEAQKPGPSMTSTSDTSRRKDSAAVHLSSKRLADECSDEQNPSYKRTRATRDNPVPACSSACAPAELTKAHPVRPGPTEALPCDVAQRAVRKILRSLETMSSPLADAKKIPLLTSRVKNDRKHQSETPPASSSPFKRLRIAGASCPPAAHGRMGRKGLRASGTREEIQRGCNPEGTSKYGASAGTSSTPGTRSASSPGVLGTFCRPPLSRAEGPAAPRGEQRAAAREPFKQMTSKSPPVVVTEAEARKDEPSERVKRTPEQRRSGHFTAFLADDVNDLDDIEMDPPSHSLACKNIDKGYMSGSSSSTSSSSSTPTKGLVNNASASTLVPPSRSPTSSRLSEDAANGGVEGDSLCSPADESKGRSPSSSEGRAAGLGAGGKGPASIAWECDTCLVWNAGWRRRCIACDVPLPSVLALRSVLVPRPSSGEASEKKTDAGGTGQQGSADGPNGPSPPGSIGLDSNTEGAKTSVEVARDAVQVEVNTSTTPPSIPPSLILTPPSAGVAAGGDGIDAGPTGSSAAVAASQTKASGMIAGAAASHVVVPASVHIGHLPDLPNTAPAGRFSSEPKPFTVADAGLPSQLGVGSVGGGDGFGQQPQPTHVSGVTAVAAAPNAAAGDAPDHQGGDVAGKGAEPQSGASAAGKQAPQFSFGSSMSGFKIDFSGLQQLQQGLGSGAGFRFGAATFDGTLGNPAPASNTATQPGTTSVVSSSSSGGGGTQPNATDGLQPLRYPVGASAVNPPGSAPPTNPSLVGLSAQAALSPMGISPATTGGSVVTGTTAPVPSGTAPALQATSANCLAPAASGAVSGISAVAPPSSAFPFLFGSLAAASGKTDAGSLFTIANTATANPSGGASTAPLLGVVGNPTFSAAASNEAASKLSFAFGTPALPTTSSAAVVVPTVAFGGSAIGPSASAQPAVGASLATTASGAGNPFVFGAASSGSGAAATTAPAFTFGKSAASAAAVPVAAVVGSTGTGGNVAAPTLTFGQTAPSVAATSAAAASPFTFKGGVANAVATTAAPLFNFGAIRTSGGLASSNPSIFTFGSGSSAVKTSTTVAQAPIFSFGGAASTGGALTVSAPPQGAASVTIQPFQFGASTTTAGTTATSGSNFAFGGAPSGAAPAPTFTKPEAPASVFKFGSSGAVNSGAAQPAGFAFGAAVPSAVAAAPAAPTAPTLSFGLQGGSKPEAAAGFTFGAVAPAPASAPSAVPLFNFTNAESSGNNNNSAGFRFPTNTNPAAFGAQPGSQPGFGQTANLAPVFGHSPNPSPVFGQAANQTPAFGQGTNQGLAFGQQANQAAMFGQTTNQASAFGAATSAFSQTINQNTAFASPFGQPTNPPPAFNATPANNNAGGFQFNPGSNPNVAFASASSGPSPFTFGATQTAPPQAFPSPGRPTFTIGSAGSNRGNSHRRIRTARRRRDQNDPALFH